MTVVLLHAGVCDHRMWDRVRPVLHDAGLRVAAPDLRGFGSRPAGVGSFSHAHDVLSLIDGLGADTVDLVGASFGGRVALQVAALAPQRVRSLALLAPALPDWDFSDPDLLAYGEAEEAAVARGDIDAAVDLNVNFWASELSPEDRAYVAEAQRRTFEHGGEADEEELPLDLSAITMPAYVLVGEADKPDFVAIARHLGETLPQARVDEIASAGHLLALERSDEVSALLAAWLRLEE
ncbi:MAG TPA: alpha/beta hydrolase [Solirubrobacteraceae bacterium]|jgi:pimeloyl-ACP methyl ester carboxylesterase